MNKLKMVAIGVNSKTKKCCCIYSCATFEKLKENFRLYKKIYISTNCNGCDDVERVLKLEKKHITGRKFFQVVEVERAEPDKNGYQWRFIFDVVMEVKQGTNK